MVFKKLLAGLGIGGVEVDTVLSPAPATPGAALTGQVNLRAKGGTDITAIHLIIVANSGIGEVQLARYQVAGALHLTSGTNQSVPFTVTLPPSTPFTGLYGKTLPGVTVGVRTEVSVAAGSAKSDFDPARIDATATHQRVLDALGAIGCRFVRNELRPGQPSGLTDPIVQAITFYAPLPEGQQPGPHIPQLTFLLTADGQTTTVVAELATRPGAGQPHRLSDADIARLGDDSTAWIDEIDSWVTAILTTLSQPPAAPAGSFMQAAPHQAGHPQGYGQPHYGQPAYGTAGKSGYTYGGHHQQHGYSYSGHKRGGMGMGGAVAAGVGGAALGFLGGMIIGDMIGDAFEPDAVDAAADGGGEDAGMDSGGFEDTGMDSGGFDDFGGGFDEF